jgi:hypothetical protein
MLTPSLQIHGVDFTIEMREPHEAFADFDWTNRVFGVRAGDLADF